MPKKRWKYKKGFWFNNLRKEDPIKTIINSINWTNHNTVKHIKEDKKQLNGILSTNN